MQTLDRPCYCGQSLGASGDHTQRLHLRTGMKIKCVVCGKMLAPKNMSKHTAEHYR